ncbi:PREDICTED: kelch-like protein 5 isoform X2 [Rhagoletis zephyria]|uniref:kelch-like protein 5 isoform X2 n=1 Tax=Rhagoletis zephyria TaxID=28612 RepID=UPI000811366A|nr:PREDICTED: kelch-like protein 5 isoform X2 [Rhagoletis zephyria]
MDVNGQDLNHFIKKLLNNICDFYDEQDLIDVTFKLSNPTAMVPAHRLILSAASPYFKDLFKSDKGLTPVIEIIDIDSDTFERLITFCYTGQTLVTIDNVDAMLKAAIYLKLDEAVVNCVDYILEHITDYTLQRAYSLERETQCVPLYEKLLEYDINNFMEISKHREFLSFDAEKLQAIIESHNLNVTCEEDAFYAVKQWYEYDASGRKHKLPDLISRLRLTLFDTSFLLRNVQTLPGCESLAFKATSWISLPSQRALISLKYTEPRRNVCVKEEDTTLLAVQAYGCTGTIFQYDQTEDKWQKYAELEHYASAYGMCLMEDNIIYIGGVRDGEITSGVESWSLKTKTWRTLPSMIQSRCWPSVVLLNGNVYAIGGTIAPGQRTQSVEKYSPGGRWKLVSSMIMPRSQASAVALNDKIFVIGGHNGNDLKTVECYDPFSNTWTKCGHMNEINYSPGVAVHNGCIYVLGGTSDKKTLECYDPQSNKWTKMCSLNMGRPYIGCVFVSDQLWAVGGWNSNSVSVYYAKTDEWLEKKPISEAGRYCCYVVPKALLLNQ